MRECERTICTHDAYARGNERKGRRRRGTKKEENELVEGGSRVSTPATRLDWSVNILFRAESDLHTKWPFSLLVCSALFALRLRLDSTAGTSAADISRQRYPAPRPGTRCQIAFRSFGLSFHFDCIACLTLLSLLPNIVRVLS